jgi:hypothetical protein
MEISLFVLHSFPYPPLNDNGQAQQGGMDMFYPKPITVKTVSDIQASNEAVVRIEKLVQWETSIRQANADNGESEKTCCCLRSILHPHYKHRVHLLVLRLFA